MSNRTAPDLAKDLVPIAGLGMTLPVRPASGPRAPLRSLSAHPVLLALLRATGLAIRLVQIDVPPLDFHPVRQYHSLLIARAEYVATISDMVEEKRQAALISREQQVEWEPQIVERLAALGYRLAGGERFWIPRALSSLYWMAGGVLLYAVARALTDKISALCSTSVYLLAPFGVMASRSFQPDPLMIFGVLGSVLAIVRYYERPSALRLLIAGLISAAAIITKFVGLFPILGAFIGAGLARQGLRGFLGSPALAVFVALSTPAAVLVYAERVFLSQSLLGVAQGDILPQLLVEPFFWLGWMHQIGVVTGYPLLIVSLLGTVLLPQGLPRALLLGLWIGYLGLGLVFTYTIYTHDYWSLTLVPIAALGAGPVGSLIVARLRQDCRRWPWRLAAGGILGLAVLLATDHALPRPDRSAFERKVETAEEIGALLSHSTRTVYLSRDYGLPLEYHGFLSGRPWPLASDLEWERLAGERTPTAEERFATAFAPRRPEYFIVLDMPELEAQDDLRRLLDTRFALLARGADYLIYDLRDR